MRNSTGQLNDFAVRPRGISPRKASPLNIFGGTAAALAVLGCAWAVYANVLGASIYPAVTASGVDVVDAPPLNESAKQKSSLALLAAAYPPAAASPELTFAERLAGLDRPSVASSSQGNLQANIDIDTQGPSKSRTRDVATSQDAPPPPAVRQVASIPVPARRSAESRLSQNKNSANSDLVQRAKATVLASTGSTTPSIFEKLFGKPESHSQPLAYASADAGVQSDGRDIAESPSPRYDRMTAVYDISAHTVYMPDGTKLEAHSGLGSALDDPRHVRERMRGATPPHIYDLAMRESLFHGVPALRLKPVGGEEAIYGRSGLLAHTYMLGPNGDSNGCVSFKDYNAFLRAYKDQQVKRLVVVAHLD
jgi:type VI secretion system (T6SS) effector TldE1-like protein